MFLLNYLSPDMNTTLYKNCHQTDPNYKEMLNSRVVLLKYHKLDYVHYVDY